MYVLRIIGLVNGLPTEFDGQYIVNYDPERDMWSRYGLMACYLETTWKVEDARTFDTPGEYLDYWRKIPAKEPIRPDGEPNRPLTAFTVEALKLVEITP